SEIQCVTEHEGEIALRCRGKRRAGHPDHVLRAVDADHPAPGDVTRQLRAHLAVPAPDVQHMLMPLDVELRDELPGPAKLRGGVPCVLLRVPANAVRPNSTGSGSHRFTRPGPRAPAGFPPVSLPPRACCSARRPRAPCRPRPRGPGAW